MPHRHLLRGLRWHRAQLERARSFEAEIRHQTAQAVFWGCNNRGRQVSREISRSDTSHSPAISTSGLGQEEGLSPAHPHCYCRAPLLQFAPKKKATIWSQS